MHAELLFGTAAMCTFLVAVACLIALPFGLWFQRGIAENKAIAAAYKAIADGWRAKSVRRWLREVEANKAKRKRK